ncbi:hypothetical protein IJI91_01765 [Candidatus Saccharibacteria bacterium]|nr:hypothetical protein [Candidatus Saccharibacteria bacterium]
MKKKETISENWQSPSPFEALVAEREFAEKIKDKVFYAGVFVNREELYDKTGAKLKNTVEKPHVTTNFQPNETQLHLDSLGSGVRIFAIGYGNNGKNEGLLVKVVAEDPEIQTAIDKIEKPHITLSSSEDSHPMYTPEALGLDDEGNPVKGFRAFGEDEQFEIDGKYGLYMKKDDAVVEDRNTLENYLDD